MWVGGEGDRTSFFLAVVIPKNPYPASDVSTEKPSIHNSTTTVLEHQPGQKKRKQGKKRGRSSKPLIPHPISTPSKSAETLKFPKKRGPKPGSKVGKNVSFPEGIKGSKRITHLFLSTREKCIVGSFLCLVYIFPRVLLSLSFFT